MSRGCSCCADTRIKRRDFRQGAVDIDDFVDETPYRKSSRSNWHNKRTRACKKSKTGEQCDYTVPKITWSYFSKNDSMWHYTRVMTCSRCGKHGPLSFLATITRMT